MKSLFGNKVLVSNSSHRRICQFVAALVCFITASDVHNVSAQESDLQTQSKKAQAVLDFKMNSVDKIRLTPSDQALRIGSAVNWQPDFETAVQKSKETGKPIFWYVPTLRGSFMDRKPSIDRYMLAGPFSWPAIIEVLNEHFIPVKAQPDRRQQKKFQLIPYVFIEPGFVILDSRGDEKLKIDRLTTLHPKWFYTLLTSELNQPPQPPQAEQDGPLGIAWEMFEAGQYEKIRLPKPGSGSPTAAEEWLLAGMVDFRLGKHDDAKQKWQQAAQSQPDHPLAWKAAAEAEGIGPFVRGFETHRSLPTAALQSGLKSPGSTAPRGTYNETEIWQRATQFLLGMQNQHGGFTDCDYDFGGTDSLPNVHVAVTSLAGMALIDTRSHFANDVTTSLKIETAIARAADYVADDRNINTRDRDEILWAFAYRIRFLARLTQIDARYKETLQVMVKELESIQSESGAWFHEYNNSFVTATALLALKEAQAAGVSVNQAVVDNGISALSRDRMGNGAYPYSSTGPDKTKEAGTDRHIAASAGRMPLCELGLFVWGHSDNEAVTSAVERSLDQNEHLMAALKYDDHTSRMAYGGFFFWYDIRARSEAIDFVADPKLKLKFHATQREIVMALPEVDGCFVDSHELGRVYGTAMALLSLTRSGR